jgi:hypothetical protein
MQEVFCILKNKLIHCALLCEINIYFPLLLLLEPYLRLSLFFGLSAP